jgi:hypothetical protein
MEQDQMEMAQKQEDKWETVKEKNPKNFPGAKEETKAEALVDEALKE